MVEKKIKKNIKEDFSFKNIEEEDFLEDSKSQGKISEPQIKIVKQKKKFFQVIKNNKFIKSILIIILFLILIISLIYIFNPNKGEEEDAFINERIVNNNNLYIACMSWKTQDSEYCSKFPEKYIPFVNETDIRKEEQNCRIYYYEALAFKNKDEFLCSNSPEAEKCKLHLNLIHGEINKEMSNKEIINIIDHKLKTIGETGISAQVGKFESIALYLRDASFCKKADYKKLKIKYPDNHIENCIIFSSEPSQLDCNRYLE